MTGGTVGSGGIGATGGPGLGVRILGEVKKEYADILREADAIFLEELHNFDWYHKFP